MGGTSQQQQESRPSEPIYASPTGAVFSNFFGVPMRYDPRRGGFEVGGQPGSRVRGQRGGGLGFANRMFYPESFDVLQDQMAPVGQSRFAPQALQGLDMALGLYDESIYPGLEELIGTGYRTDVGPYREQAMRGFQQETIPGLAEQYAFLGGGGQTLSSDFGAAAARAGADLWTDITAMDVGLGEAAAQRRLEGLELGGILGRERAGLPLEVGAGVMGLEDMFREYELSRRPGGRMMGFLGDIMGLEREPIVQANFSQGAGGAWNIL